MLLIPSPVLHLPLADATSFEVVPHHLADERRAVLGHVIDLVKQRFVNGDTDRFHHGRDCTVEGIAGSTTSADTGSWLSRML
jgi:hypothetical protein